MHLLPKPPFLTAPVSLLAVLILLAGCNTTAQAPPPDLTQARVENPLPPPPSNTPAPAFAAGNAASPGPTAAAALAGPSTPSQNTAQPALVSDPSFSLPKAAGCSGSVERFQMLVDNDLKTGHTTKEVRNEISEELTSLRGRCANGEDTSEDVVLLRQRFGYPSI